MLKKDYVSYIIILAFHTYLMPLDSKQQQYIRQMINLLQIINRENVNTKLKDIPESDIKTLHDYPLEYAAKIKIYTGIIPEELNQIIHHLLSVGANPNIYTHCPALLALACLNQYHLVKNLIQHGAVVKPGMLIQIFRNLMLEGKQYLDPDIIQILLEHGADINYKDTSFNQTVLFYAHHPVVVYSLLSHGADPKARNSDRQTCKEYWLEFNDVTKNLQKSLKMITIYEKLIPIAHQEVPHKPFNANNEDETKNQEEENSNLECRQYQQPGIRLFHTVFMHAFWRCVNDEPELLKDIIDRSEHNLHIKNKIENMFEPRTLQDFIQFELQQQILKKQKIEQKRKSKAPLTLSCNCNIS